MHFDLLCFALWFISEIEMVLFRIIFRAFEVGETRCGASRAASTLGTQGFVSCSCLVTEKSG